MSLSTSTHWTLSVIGVEGESVLGPTIPNSVTVMSYVKDRKVLNGEGLYVCVGHSA